MAELSMSAADRIEALLDHHVLPSVQRLLREQYGSVENARHLAALIRAAEDALPGLRKSSWRYSQLAHALATYEEEAHG